MMSITHPNIKILTVRKRQGERALAILLVFCSDLRMKSSNIGGGGGATNLLLERPKRFGTGQKIFRCSSRKTARMKLISIK